MSSGVVHLGEEKGRVTTLCIAWTTLEVAYIKLANGAAFPCSVKAD
jgi:hypothetical protein